MWLVACCSGVEAMKGGYFRQQFAMHCKYLKGQLAAGSVLSATGVRRRKKGFSSSGGDHKMAARFFQNNVLRGV